MHIDPSSSRRKAAKSVHVQCAYVWGILASQNIARYLQTQFQGDSAQRERYHMYPQNFLILCPGCSTPASIETIKHQCHRMHVPRSNSYLELETSIRGTYRIVWRISISKALGVPSTRHRESYAEGMRMHDLQAAHGKQAEVADRSQGLLSFYGSSSSAT